MVQNNVVLKTISPLSTVNDILTQIECEDKVDCVEMLFDCIPEECYGMETLI